MRPTMHGVAYAALSTRCRASEFVNSSQTGGSVAAGDAMDFRILGPLEACSGGLSLHLGGPRQRALLAYLLLHANEVVSAERLLDELWFEAPSGGLAALQTQISRLRKVVGEKLVSSAGGYSLCIERDELDLLRLRGLLADAGVAAD